MKIMGKYGDRIITTPLPIENKSTRSGFGFTADSLNWALYYLHMLATWVSIILKLAKNVLFVGQVIFLIRIHHWLRLKLAY